VVERGLALGVAVSPGRLFVIGESEHPHLRLSFAAIEAASVDEAVRRLAQAIAQDTKG
jgi:DNA-binding transcriptional MocR family regulator